jgi:hypothetical protein
MTRGDLENQTKDEVISTALQLRRSNEGQAVQLLETERALVQMRAAEVEKYDGGRLLIEGAGGTLVVGGAGELINWFLAWLGTPPGNGAQQGLISAWVMRNFALLRSVPHIILGLALAVGTKPTPRSGMVNDGLHEGGKALATAGAARFIDWMKANRMDRAASADEVAQKLAAVTAQLAAAQAQINKQKQG